MLCQERTQKVQSHIQRHCQNFEIDLTEHLAISAVNLRVPGLKVLMQVVGLTVSHRFL